jgi:heme a synthase
MNKLKAVKILRYIAMIAACLALFVIMLGAYTRLTDAGLGCPDWPGCYGHLVAPTHTSNINIEPIKAWTEMIHRYVAGSLVLLISGLILGVRYVRRSGGIIPIVIPIGLLFLLASQAALGMWTVTLKLLPIVVMGHLLGGFLIFSCLIYYSWQLWNPSWPKVEKHCLWMVNIGLLIAFGQIALGGWVSSNYAGISCIGFPFCNGQFVPPLLLAKAFTFWPEVGANYQGGILDNDVRVTIQIVHRFGAYVTALYILCLVGWIFVRSKSQLLRNLLVLILLCLLAQFTLGIINVLYLLPLWSAVLHNGVAALLLGLLVSLRYVVISMRKEKV